MIHDSYNRLQTYGYRVALLWLCHEYCSSVSLLRGLYCHFRILSMSINRVNNSWVVLMSCYDGRHGVLFDLTLCCHVFCCGVHCPVLSCSVLYYSLLFCLFCSVSLCSAVSRCLVCSLLFHSIAPEI